MDGVGWDGNVVRDASDFVNDAANVRKFRELHVGVAVTVARRIEHHPSAGRLRPAHWRSTVVGTFLLTVTGDGVIDLGGCSFGEA